MSKFSTDKQKEKLYKKYLILTIIMDLLFFTLFWALLRLWFIYFILKNSSNLNPEYFKKLLFIWGIPLIIWLLLLVIGLIAIWWCLSTLWTLNT